MFEVSTSQHARMTKHTNKQNELSADFLVDLSCPTRIPEDFFQAVVVRVQLQYCLLFIKVRSFHGTGNGVENVRSLLF